MKYRYYSQLPEEPVPGVFTKDGTTSVLGKVTVRPEDQVGHSTYEIRPKSGDQLSFKSPDPITEDQFGTNHIYVCLNGNGVATVGSDDFQMAPGSALALPPAIEATFSASTDQLIRIMVIHCESCSSDPALPSPTYRDLKEIIGTDRDVNWFHGQSRRFLSKPDGFNISLNNVTGEPYNSSPLCYESYFESAYFTRGEMRYEWDKGKSETSFKQTDASDGDALVMLMDQHDAHVAHVLGSEVECYCVLYPALLIKGTEAHDFSRSGLSAY